jgi:hypothetical protein
MALVAGYAVGMLSSSRTYAVPTYLLVGLVAAYLNLARAYVPQAVPRWDRRTAWQLVAVNVLAVAGTQMFIRLSVNWG